MRRHVLLPLLCLSLALPAVAAGSAKTSWAQPQIKLVTAHGLMGGDPTTFEPDSALTQNALAELVADLTNQESSTPAAPEAPVTVAALDTSLVRALGLRDAASSFANGVRAAGLAPPSRFGSEAVARLLGLRTNHPTGQDSLELLPADAATRAEAAFSAAQILDLDEWETQRVRDAALTFELPDLTSWQRRILHTAVSFIGYPYIWGGTSEKAQAPLGVRTPGGFDCSGFVWRVYKLQPYAGAPQLSQAIRGRTTMHMSGEVAKSARIHFDELEPGDVLFFGAQGPKSRPAQVNHAGIYLGNGWFIHSSGYGVAVAQLDRWYESAFAWGRRPLNEAGLVSD
jgi:cell wall-associated NlpC family hydrolase